MRETLIDIRTRLEAGEYRNEQHVRINLVLRLLQDLGWNIWDPNIVFPELLVAPNEDKTKVDFALFLSSYTPPSIFVEIKTVGELPYNLPKIERQLRDYNRNNTAEFSIITDGRLWFFYFSQTGGEFSSKQFKKIDLIKDDLDDVELSLLTFLGEKEIRNGAAKSEAEKYLRLSQEQRVLEDSLAQARRIIQEPPFPSLPESLIELVRQKGVTVTREKAEEFIRSIGERKIERPEMSSPERSVLDHLEPRKVRGNAEANPTGSKKFTKIISAKFADQSAKNWRQLYRLAITFALKRGYSVSSIGSIIGGGIKEGIHTESGFAPLEGFKISVQDVDANGCFDGAKTLAEKIGTKFFVSYESPSGEVEEFQLKNT